MKLVIVGDGELRGYLEERAKGLGAEFAGQMANSDVCKRMGESRATVLPSECWEGMPITLIETFRRSTPSVVSNLGALPEFVQDGKFGEVFEAGNAEALAAAIKRLLARPDYNEMCKAARREAETKYSEDANYKRLMEIYEEVVSR